MELTDQEILQEAINRYGVDAQLTKCTEELGELIVALSKYKQTIAECKIDNIPPLEFQDGRYVESLSNVLEEVADVGIMIKQIEMIFKAKHRISERKKFKISRLKERLGL